MVAWNRIKSLPRCPGAVEKRLPFLVALLGWGFQALADPGVVTGRDFVEQKRWSEAVVLLKAELVESSRLSGVRSDRWAEATLDLARALTHSGRREEAVRLLNSAGGRFHSRSDVLSRVFLSSQTLRDCQDGWGLMRQERFQEALQKFESANQRETANVEVLIRMGQSQYMLGQLETSVEFFRTAFGLNPHRPEIKLWLGRALLSRGNSDEAWVLLEEARNKMPDSDLANAWWAEALEARGERGRAILELRRHVEENPGHASSLVQWVEMILSLQSNDMRKEIESLWQARKNLRAVSVNADSIPSTDGELGFAFLRGQRLERRAQTLLSRVDVAVEATSGRSRASP